MKLEFGKLYRLKHDLEFYNPKLHVRGKEFFLDKGTILMCLEIDTEFESEPYPTYYFLYDNQKIKSFYSGRTDDDEVHEYFELVEEET